jgi:hypothetical protein
MHAICIKHTWKSTVLVELQKPSRVLSIGCSQILFLEHPKNCNRKPLDTLDG